METGLQHLLAFPEIIKMRKTEKELEPFFDFWYQKLGWVVIRGFNDYCGRIPDESVIHLLPSQRKLCMKIQNRLTVFADGAVPICAQDYSAEEPVGNAFETSLKDLWECERLQTLRQEHLDQNYEGFKLCPACKDWHYL